MRKITLVILAVIISGVAIAKHKKQKKGKEANEIISVQVSRTGCFGQCPVYSVEINRNGIATYTGIRFNTDSGVYTKNIGTSKALEILNKITTFRADTCKDGYDIRPDLPGINFKIQYTGKTKNIENAGYGPVFLSLLTREIEATGKKTDDIGWKNVTTAQGK